MRAALAVATVAAVAASQAARASGPDQESVEWVREHAIPLETTEAGHGFDDLAPLRELIGDARIVSLGECTHGTREVFQMKHRLVEFLATELGFTVFSIEANMPESYRLNEFVIDGRGDPKALIAGMYFWTWNTHEVLDMVRWMRDHNASGRGSIEFTGFDMQTPTVAMQIVRDFVDAHDPELVAAAHEAFEATASARPVQRGGNFGVATGSFPVALAAGKRITFRGAIRTEGVTRGRAGLWWRVDGGKGTLAFDNMQDRGPRGDAPWSEHEIELDVPAGATNINFGMLHPGDGTAWFDSLEIEIDGKPFEDAELFDLDFERGVPEGFFTGGAGYDVRVDADEANTGKQSLRMRFQGPVAPPAAQARPADAIAVCREVIRRIETQREAYLEAGVTAHEIEWTLQNARVGMQCMQMFAGQVARDESMARNVKWILDTAPPETRIVLWAHNWHVQKTEPSMGGFLEKWYGDDHLVIGFAAGTGTYTAIGAAGLSSDHELSPPIDGSVEAVFAATGIDRFVLDVRGAAAADPASAWLTRPVRFRSIGARAMEQQFFPMMLTDNYDAIIYFDRTEASRPIGRQ